MARDITAALLAQFEGQTLRPAAFFEGEFATGTLRYWTGQGDKSWNGQTWVGVGGLISLEPIKETADVVANGTVVVMSGAQTSNVQQALSGARQGKPGRVYIGALAEDGSVIVDPDLAFEGRMDVPEIEKTGDTCTVRISYEHRLVALERANIRRYTHEDQQIDYPGDMGLEFVAGLQDKQLVWGAGS
jgi:hypothetical protein